jgi:hypothetical protein
VAPDDPMWSDFWRLWSDLLVAGRQVLLAGGYGLFLKQRWLLANRDKAIVIPLDNWQAAAPRVTNDLDILIGLELLASVEAQAVIVQAMERNGFNVVETNPRWQFQKQLGSDGRILVDLHAESPESENPNLKLDKRRIKHKPSLGDKGVHGRQNPQAAGCGLHPFFFGFDDITISVPNPVTWSVMKLVSTRDRRRMSDDAEQSEKHRSFHMQQAIKHAQDVARVVAMTTRDERDHAPDVIASIRENASFADAVAVFHQLFRGDDSWGAIVAARMWRDDDFNLIRRTLGDWFR